MKKLSLILVAGLLVFQVGCKDDDPIDETPAGPGESTTELLVASFTAAPTMDGDIDAMWGNAQKLVGTTEVPTLGARNTYLNSDGAGIEEGLGLFFPYSGEKNNFSMRSGTYGDDIFFLIEWDDSEDSMDRQSWYFDSNDSKWKQEHKYANASDDKYYEDKFAFLFPIGEVAGFSSSSCYATCHGTGGAIANPKDKHTRHYLTGANEKIDMWHWKRVRGTHNDRVDDQMMTWADPSLGSGANGRHGDSDGSAGYSNNSVTFNVGGVDITVPKYIDPLRTSYFWITEEEAGTSALEVVGVDANGVLQLSNTTLLDPAGDAGFAKGTGNKRVPSVITSDFTGGRADISIKAVHTGSGWVCEVQRKLNTNDVDDVVFDKTAELPFGFAIFNNAAIAHGIKTNLTMKFAN